MSGRRFATSVLAIALAAACSAPDPGTDPVDGGPTGDASGADVGAGTDAAEVSDISDAVADDGDTPAPPPDVVDAGPPPCELDCSGAFEELAACTEAAVDVTTCTCVVVASADLSPCSDDDLCTAEDRCVAGACVGTPLQAEDLELCDDGDPCTDDDCDPAEGCVYAQAEDCVDPGVTCPVNETCEAVHGDGDPCNGELACTFGLCALVPGSAIVCPASTDGCTTWSCEPLTGGCVPEARADGAPCLDGDPCTVDDACDAGACVGLESGVAACGCETDETCLPWDDGDPCNGVPTCQDGVCQADPSTAPDCDPSTTLPCFTLYCDPADGFCKAAPLPDGLACEPVDPCGTAGTCASGECVVTEAVDCSDLDGPCAVGACDDVTGACVATYPLHGEPCIPDDPCGALGVCEEDVCEITQLDPCHDGDPCTLDFCEPGTGCQHDPGDIAIPACPDEGVCAAGVPLSCVGGDHYVCDLAATPGYAEVEVCDGQDNDCDGLTDEACVEGLGCGVGVLVHDYGTGMQACSSPDQLWSAALCGPGWHPCTYSELVNRVAGQVVPSEHWIDARIAWDGAAWTVVDTPGEGCHDFEGSCGQVHALQAMSWYGLWQGSVPLAAEAWGCQLGLPSSSCQQIALDGVLCCEPACSGDADCDDGSACTVDTCDAAAGTCTHELDPSVPGCAPCGVGELCDGIDNDCDGLTDAEDPIDLLLGDVQGCEAELGVCGTVTKPVALCQGGAWQPCVPTTYEAALGATWEPDGETRCDGLDNDCDGATDAEESGLAAHAPLCPNQTGPCEGAQTPLNHCQAGAWQPCDFNAYLDHFPGYEPTEEGSCDAVDNDCDGVTDEPFTYEGAVMGAVCSGIGGCGPGVVECASSDDHTTCSSNPDGSAPGIHPEVCDGIDNDCNGQTDEELTTDDAGCLYDGVCLPEAVIEKCEGGVWVCDYSLVEGYEPEPEASCDSEDNDCDGLVDETFTWTHPDTGEELHKLEECGTPECPNLVVCNPFGEGVICTSELPGFELCDEADNDCDGDTDEGLSYANPPDGTPSLIGEPCDGIGECGLGITECDDVGQVTCSTNHDGSSPEAVAESCNGLDDDCDGAIDETFTYFGQPVGEWCDGKGLCGLGVVECGPNPDKAVCSTNPWASEDQSMPEVCNGLDDDCDNLADEGLGFWDSTCKKTGVCSPQTVDATCIGPPGWLCEYQHPVYSGDDEIGWCDGLDNDCDGLTDEDYPEIGGTCDGPDEDLCANGIWLCNTHNDGVECVADQPQVESCASPLDDDCDGLTDEGDAIDCTVYYVDDDLDGAGDPDAPTACQCPGWEQLPWTAPAGDDCCDSETDAHPDAPAFHADPTACGGFDWNCDEAETPEHPSLGACDGCVWVPGWLDAVPACGELGTFVTGCSEGSCLPLTAPATQMCR